MWIIKLKATIARSEKSMTFGAPRSRIKFTSIRIQIDINYFIYISESLFDCLPVSFTLEWSGLCGGNDDGDDHLVINLLQMWFRLVYVWVYSMATWGKSQKIDGKT